MCYSTTLDKEVRDLERVLNRRMIEAARRIHWPDDDRSMPFGQTSAFTRPFWPVLSSATPAQIDIYRWGFFPRNVSSEAEAKEFIKTYTPFNAIAEEVETKRMYRDAWWKGQRCLVPVTHFTEWQHIPVEGKKTPRKVPFNIRSTEEITFLGGIWQDTLLGYRTYTILTTKANPLMEIIHNSRKRQPVIIPSDMAQFWLSPGIPPDQAMSLCAAIPERDMIAEEKAVA